MSILERGFYREYLGPSLGSRELSVKKNNNNREVSVIREESVRRGWSVIALLVLGRDVRTH